MKLVARDAALAAAMLLALAASGASAEKADRQKPTLIDSNRMSADDARRMSVFEGNVVLSKGTLSVRADRIVVREDAEGFQHATATGSPVRFRQKADPKDGRPAVWIVGEALRIEVDDRNQRVELFQQAHVARGQDEVRGNYILLDQRADSFSVSGGKGESPGGGRVRAVIQPKTPPATEGARPAAAPGAAPAPATPGARQPSGTK